MTDLEIEVPHYGEAPFGLRPGDLIGPTADVLAQAYFEIPQENEADYWLLRQTAILGEGIGVEDEERAKLLGLVMDLYRVDPEFARGSMLALPIALGTADVLEEAGVPVDRAMVWKGITHDVGKAFVEKETRQRSNAGVKDYGAKGDHEKMELHVVLGFLKLNYAGLHEESFLPAGHHLMQPYNPYGMDIKLTPGKETALFCVANGDSESAVMTRENSRSIQHPDWDTKMALRREQQRGVIVYMLENSSNPIMNGNSEELADRILERTWHPVRPEQAAADRERAERPRSAVRGLIVLSAA